MRGKRVKQLRTVLRAKLGRAPLKAQWMHPGYKRRSLVLVGDEFRKFKKEVG